MKRNILAGSLYLFITLVVMFSWFHYGLMYGGGDVGLPTHNPQRVLQMASQPWWTETAPGFPRPQNLTALPAYVFFAFLQNLGLPAFMIQAVIFGILLFLMGFGMYLLAKNIMKNENRGMAILAGLFYMVNPYMMVLVWHRFTHTTFFFVASLPLLLLFWRKWMREKEFTSLIIFIAVNLIFSYMFGTLAYAITLWFLLGMYTLFEIFIPWIGWKKASQISASFSLGLILWVLTNTWWILPAFFILPTLASAQHAVGDTLSTLFAIGEQSIIPYSLPGLNSFYLFQRQELGEVFKHPLFLFIPWIGVSFTIIGIYYTKKSRELIFWSILFILAVFLAKGVAPPLGYFYPYMFEKFFFLGVLRNPFEKFGLLIPFAGSVLFSVGFFNLATYFWKRNNLAGKAVLILSFGLFFGVYHWPFWTGTLFGTLEKRNFVEIPPYYQQANLWIKNQKKDGNILHLPLAITDASTYRWQYGYSGAESNAGFFTSNPSISMGFNLSYLDDALQGFDLMTSFDQIKYAEYLKELFRAFNVRFIVLHYDINWQASGVQSPEEIGKILDSLPFLKKQKEIEEVTVYEMDEKSFLSKIYTASYFNYLKLGSNYDTWFWFLRSDPTRILLSDKSDSNELTNLSGYKQTILIPTTIVKISSTQLASEENSLKELPPARFLPDLPLYPMIILKEFIQASGYQKTKENIHLTFAGKRLVEIYRMQDKDPNKSVSPIIQRYIQHLNKAVDKIFKDGLISVEAPTEFKILFSRHEVVLRQIYQRAKDQDKAVLSQAIETLRMRMIDMKMQPIYELISERELARYNRQVHRFFIPVDGEYEILMADSKVSPIYQKNLSQLDLQVDKTVQSRTGQIKDDLISYGTIPLNEGLHEISFNMQNSVNLIKDKQGEIRIVSGQHNPNSYEIKVEPFHPNSTYLLSFEYWTQKGSDPIVRILQDSDPDDYLVADALIKQRSYQFIKPVEFDPYNKYWKTYNLYISPRKNSANFSFQVVSIPWDDCKSIIAEKWLCDKQEVKFNFQKTSSISIRNIRVFRILDNLLFLRSISANQTSQIVSLNYTKKAPLEYEGNIVLDKPSYMIFSETFNDNWKLTLFDGEKEYMVPKHFFANMYGNGWFIDKKGNYKFRIRFSGDKYLYLGIYISVFSLLIFTIVHLVGKYLKWSHEKSN
ncbi:MAG: Uncharacterized protein G01um10147_459 [Microgenomates group bacterium Gr01-1014_7]|nr:MAG: Uncharacterized protein G01um10147_459 [Microgenomates group bacterium Gr01-1014_7]